MTPAEHADNLAWVRETLATLNSIGATLSGYFLALTLAEAILTRHAPEPEVEPDCNGCSWPKSGHFREWPCPDVEPPMTFVKAVRG